MNRCIQNTIVIIVVCILTSCSTLNSTLKLYDVDYKYEVGKQYYAMGKYQDASLVFSDVLASLKGTTKGDECLFMLGMSSFMNKDYELANKYMSKYYSVYSNGVHVDEAYFYSGLSLYKQVPIPKLDQTNTYLAINELQSALEFNYETKYSSKINNLLINLQNKLVEKEYLAANLYYKLGDYFDNSMMGGSNYEACIVTSQNAIKEYPYSLRKEDFSILILKARYELALKSVEDKKKDRYTETIDEYYGFINEFPQSKYKKEANTIFEKAKKEILIID